jgi:hypothetical protein
MKVRAVGVRAEPEGDDLRSDDAEQRAADRGMQLPGPAEELESRDRDGEHERAEAA